MHSLPIRTDPPITSALNLLLTQAMAAQLYACGQIKNNADVVMSDSTKKEKMNKVDFFIIPLQQEADRIGLGKEYAPVVKDATLLASARLEDLEARKSKAARHTKLAELLEISQEQYAKLAEENSDSGKLFVPVLMLTTKTAKMTTPATAIATLRKSLNQLLPSHFQQSLSLLRRRSGQSLSLPGRCSSRRLRSPECRSTRRLSLLGRRAVRVQDSERPPQVATTTMRIYCHRTLGLRTAHSTTRCLRTCTLSVQLALRMSAITSTQLRIKRCMCEASIPRPSLTWRGPIILHTPCTAAAGSIPTSSSTPTTDSQIPMPPRHPIPQRPEFRHRARKHLHQSPRLRTGWSCLSGEHS